MLTMNHPTTMVLPSSSKIVRFLFTLSLLLQQEVLFRMVTTLLFLLQPGIVSTRCFVITTETEVAAAATTTQQQQPPLFYIADLELIDTLVYDKSGTINSLSWSSKIAGFSSSVATISTRPRNDTLERNETTANVSVTTKIQQYNYYLAAASVASVQIWNITTTTTTTTTTTDQSEQQIDPNDNTNSSSNNNGANLTKIATIRSSANSITKWDLVQLISHQPSALIRAVSFSPNGKYLAFGNDEGMVQVYSTTTNVPWKEQSNISSLGKVNGKIRSLSWHSSSQYLAVAGISFQFIVWDLFGSNNWTVADISSHTEQSEQPYYELPDTYVHYMDWSNGNEFVVDRTIYELYHSQEQQQHAERNVFNKQNNDSTTISPTTTAMMIHPIAVLDACRLCTLSQWSPNGEYIATAFGSEISISQVQYTNRTTTTANSSTMDENDNHGSFTNLHVKSIYNATTVHDTYMIISTMAWSPNSRYLAVAGIGNYNVFVYSVHNNFSTPPLIVATASQQYGIDSIAWRPDGMQIAIGTSRIIEIRNVQYQLYENPTPNTVAPTAVPATTSTTTTPNDTLYPSSSPSDGTIAIVDDEDSPSLSQQQEQLYSIMSTSSMIGLGIAVVVASLSIVGIIFYQRKKYVSKMKKKRENETSYNKKSRIRTTRDDNHDNNDGDDYDNDSRNGNQEVEITTTEEDLDVSSHHHHLDRIITIPRIVDIVDH